MPKLGRQTWQFLSEPRIIATGTVGGKLESEGPLGQKFDIRHADDRVGSSTWEHAEQSMFSEAANVALTKAGISPDAVDLLVGGDLNAQLAGFYFGLRSLNIPALGIYSACASICEALAVASLALDSGMAQMALVGTSSHNSGAERQFRYPTEYGAQKPDSAQRTVTGAAMALLSKSGSNVAVTHATVGEVVDYGITSPWEMNAAMAPAAARTIEAHLQDTGRDVSDYDCIATGDLGFIGHEILADLLERRGILPRERLVDCGMLIYRRDQAEVLAGGSGGACCSLVTFGHLLAQLGAGPWKRLLVCATGALLSNISPQQGDTIPAVSHGIVFERKE